MAGKNGGARPGAGRKKKVTVEQQVVRRDVVMDVVGPDEWREHVVSLLEQSRRGNYGAMLPLYPYLLGSPKQEHEHTGKDGGPFRIIIETVADRGSSGT